MKVSAFRSLLLATTFALAGCGGGGGYVASSPPPPVTPTPTPTPAVALALVSAATTSQQFTVAGATRLTPSNPTPQLGAADQLQVRYIASSNSYEVQLPNSSSWVGLTAKSDIEGTGGDVTVVRQYGGGSYQYSSLIDWVSGGSLRGIEAIGIATGAAAVPITGSASFSGYAYGSTSESNSDLNKLVSPLVSGTIKLNFDFAQGSLSGSMDLILDPEWHDYELGTFTFRDTVYSTGSTTFSGKFNTTATGVNSFGGLFTGPNAQELIGNFALPYVSPIDSNTYQTSGAFVARK